jgi:hypothetical protein
MADISVAEQNLLDEYRGAPIAQIMPDAAEQYFAALESQRLWSNADYSGEAFHTVVRERQSAYEAETGRKLIIPPLELSLIPGVEPVLSPLDRLNKAIEADGGRPIPEAEVRWQADQKSLAARERFESVTQQRAAAGGSSAGWWASLGGQAVGAVQDPLNITMMMFGAPAAAGVLATAAIEGALAMAGQLINEVANFGQRERAAEEAGAAPYTAEEAATNVAVAGVGGAVLGGAVKGAVKLWNMRAAKGEPVPQAVQDALRVQEAHDLLTGSAPRNADPEVLDAHVEAYKQAGVQLARGEPVDVEGLFAAAPHLPDPADMPPLLSEGLARQDAVPQSLEARLLRGEADMAAERLALAQERALDLQQRHADAQAAVDALRQGAAAPEMDVAAMRAAGLDEDTLRLLEAATTERATATGRRAADLDAEIARIRETLDVVDQTLRPEAQQAVARAQREADALAAQAAKAQRSAEQWAGEVARREKYAALAEKRLLKAEQKAQKAATPAAPEPARGIPLDEAARVADEGAKKESAPLVERAIEQEVNRLMLEDVMNGEQMVVHMVDIENNATPMKLQDALQAYDDEAKQLDNLMACVIGEVGEGAV